MSYYEVGTVSRISEEYEGVMPDKALEKAMMMAKEVHREMIVFHKKCFEYHVAIGYYGAGAYDIAQRIQFDDSCSDFVPLEQLVVGFFRENVRKGVPVNSIYVAANGVHSEEFGVYL